MDGRIERFGVREVVKVGGGTACLARVLVSGERGRTNTGAQGETNKCSEGKMFKDFR